MHIQLFMWILLRLPWSLRLKISTILHKQEGKDWRSGIIMINRLLNSPWLSASAPAIQLYIICEWFTVQNSDCVVQQQQGKKGHWLFYCYSGFVCSEMVWYFRKGRKKETDRAAVIIVVIPTGLKGFSHGFRERIEFRLSGCLMRGVDDGHWALT